VKIFIYLSYSYIILISFVGLVYYIHVIHKYTSAEANTPPPEVLTQMGEAVRLASLGR